MEIPEEQSRSVKMFLGSPSFSYLIRNEDTAVRLTIEVLISMPK
jgi:hypothetical protein